MSESIARLAAEYWALDSAIRIAEAEHRTAEVAVIRAADRRAAITTALVNTLDADKPVRVILIGLEGGHKAAVVTQEGIDVVDAEEG